MMQRPTKQKYLLVKLGIPWRLVKGNVNTHLIRRGVMGDEILQPAHLALYGEISY
ncbi:MAG: hypothetical protein PVS3B3_19140 [Ktedonobacteraceae bacterium]